MKTPRLPRPALMKIGQKLRYHYETCVVERNPKLEMLALIVDAKLRDDQYLRGATFKGRPI